MINPLLLFLAFLSLSNFLLFCYRTRRFDVEMSLSPTYLVGIMVGEKFVESSISMGFFLAIILVGFFVILLKGSLKKALNIHTALPRNAGELSLVVVNFACLIWFFII